MIQNSSGSLDGSLFNQIKESLEELMIQMEMSRKLYTVKPPDEGFDYHWFFDAQTKTLERFSPNIQVEIIEDFDNDSYLCSYKDKTIIVRKDKISYEVEH